MKRHRVIIGLLGTKLDQSPPRGDRWASWRPSVAICQHDDLLVDRYELLYEQRSRKLAEQVAKDIESISPETKVRPHQIQLSDPWDFEEVYAALHQFMRDYTFDTDKEEYLAHITTGTHVAQICLFLLTESRHLPAALLQASPPRRKQKDARGSYRVIDLDLSRYDELASRFQQEHQEASSFLKSGIETRDDQFNQLIDRIEHVTLATRSPILLTGPTGAGKSQLAKRIFQLKRQREQVTGELVEVNCATIRGDQSMSTLFGHVKGAFTGAITSRPGLLKSADGGVLFLDEIGELGADEQAMLLRAIEEKTFLPVGSDRTTSADFQLIAGTNRELTREVARGAFREDLLARINLWSFRMPGLAERRADIDPNIEFELQQFTTNHGRKVTMNKEARKRFLDFALDPSTPWKANFRDLNAAITRMATLSPSGRITASIVDEEVERLRLAWRDHRESGSATGSLQSVLTADQITQLDRFDQVQLAEVICVCQHAKSLAAAGRELFSVSRRAKQQPNDSDRLRKYLAKFGISWNDI
jgi:transcriptional regulatory protein RtcR